MTHAVKREERKERVLHTRIPAALEEQIKRLADGLRVPVSNLVRNMLEDAIEMTRRVRDRVPGHVDPVVSAAGAASTGLADVFGWQKLTLNVTSPCVRCGRQLGPGDPAFLGLTYSAHASRVFICPTCLPRRGRKETNGKNKE